MEPLDIAAADRAFAETKRNPRENHPSFFVIGLMLATILAPWVLSIPFDSPRGRILIVAPWALFALLVWMSWRRARRHRHRASGVGEVWDRAQLGDWESVEAVLPSLLTRPIRGDAERCRVLLLLAAYAERQRRFDVAAHIYERLLRQRIGDAPLLQQAQLALASAKLRNEELTDAVDLLDRLQKIEMPAPLRAIYETIRLHQQVFMGHHEDAIADARERQSLFRRHLSTRAGYAYALLAAAFHRLGQHEAAQRYWRDATTLLPASDILERYDIARDVSQAYPAAERPI